MRKELFKVGREYEDHLRLYLNCGESKGLKVGECANIRWFRVPGGGGGGSCWNWVPYRFVRWSDKVGFKWVGKGEIFKPKVGV